MAYFCTLFSFSHLFPNVFINISITHPQESVKSTDAEAAVSPVPTGKQLEYLQHQLADLHLETLLGSEAKVDLTDPQGALAQ